MKYTHHKNIGALLKKRFPKNRKIADNVKRLDYENYIGNQLFMMRSNANISQDKMAKRLKVSQAKISKMENNGSSVKFNEAMEYWQALGYDISIHLSKSGSLSGKFKCLMKEVGDVLTTLLELADDDTEINQGVVKLLREQLTIMLNQLLPSLEKNRAKLKRKESIEITFAPDSESQDKGLLETSGVALDCHE